MKHLKLIGKMVEVPYCPPGQSATVDIPVNIYYYHGKPHKIAMLREAYDFLSHPTVLTRDNTETHTLRVEQTTQAFRDSAENRCNFWSP